MKIKSGVWYWLAVASGAVGLLYGMGLEGSFQTGGTVSDGAFITAMVLILLAVFFARLGFAAERSSLALHAEVRAAEEAGLSYGKYMLLKMQANKKPAGAPTPTSPKG